MPPTERARPRIEAFLAGRTATRVVLARAPGRVNLIGEHTDYNDGLVLPMALEVCTWAAASRRPDAEVHVHALDLDARAQWPAGEWPPAHPPRWTAYVAGVFELLRRRTANLAGCDVAIASDVPLGSGLSSSAALEVASAMALAQLAGLELAATELADLCRHAEHEFAGVPCGIMDQYISVLARPGTALLLDCRARTWEHVPLVLPEHVVLIVDSAVRHALADSEYAVRQQQCRTAVDAIQQVDARVHSLRDVSEALLKRAELTAPLSARARHVVREIGRTRMAADALRRGDLAGLGRLMDASHASLRDDYEVSCPEVDRLVEIVRDVPGVCGARMTGGGFGGCVVVLAAQAAIPEVERRVRQEYDPQYGPARFLESAPGAGAAVVMDGGVCA